MGWSFGHGESKRDVVAGIIKTWSYAGEDKVQRTNTCLAHCVRGTVLWYVMEITGEGLKPERWIGCSILGTHGGDGWGSKDMEESMGPCYYSCPLSYLDMVPCPGGYATEWREKVRAWWASRKPTLKIGSDHVTILNVKPGFKVLGQPVKQIEVKRVGNRIMGWVNGMKVRTVPRRMLIDAEVVPFNAPAVA